MDAGFSGLLLHLHSARRVTTNLLKDTSLAKVERPTLIFNGPCEPWQVYTNSGVNKAQRSLDENFGICFTKGALEAVTAPFERTAEAQIDRGPHAEGHDVWLPIDVFKGA